MYSGGRYSCTKSTSDQLDQALTLFFEVADEVSLGAEAPVKFLGHVTSLFGAQELLLLLKAVHTRYLKVITS